MKRLEVIHLRTVGRSIDVLINQIRDAIGTGVNRLDEVTLYCSTELESDLVVHIHHQDKGTTPSQNHLGLHLASAMSAYGLVEHTY